MPVNWAQIFGFAKKAFKWYQRRQRKQQASSAHQNQQQPGNQVHQSQQYSNQPQQPHQQSPYPPPQHQSNQNYHNQPQQHQQTQNQNHGYGSNDGVATVRDLIRFRSPGRAPSPAAWRLSPSNLQDRKYNPLLTPSLLLSSAPSFLQSRSLASPWTSTTTRIRSLASPSLLDRHFSATAFTLERHHRRRYAMPPITTYHHHTNLPAIFYIIPAFLRPLPSTYLKFYPFFFGNFDRLKNQDMMNAQNQQYVGLRNQAIQAGDLGARCSRDSQSAYQAGDGAKAKELSIEANEHRRMQDVYDGQAARWIFDQNNQSQPKGTIDLHGLYVAESIEFAERAIASAKAERAAELRIIVGKGNHSQGKVAKLKPAIENLMRKEHLSAHLDEHNSGVLVIQLQGQGVGNNRSVGSDLADKDECVVM